MYALRMVRKVANRVMGRAMMPATPPRRLFIPAKADVDPALAATCEKLPAVLAACEPVLTSDCAAFTPAVWRCRWATLHLACPLRAAVTSSDAVPWALRAARPDNTVPPTAAKPPMSPLASPA